ncbi:ABC transporter permease [Bacillus sp. 1P06AnD]|uniref:ABC transporter permease n=1 Tax=Bacillus sp. 1P06AnD TaxID=3132208 RepID=UPI0039A11FFF
MTFKDIIRKNFIYNFKKYISNFLVNSMTVTMLFILSCLLFNKDVMTNINITALYEVINISLIILILFSVFFISYTNTSFLKYRGKELGMYMTLGMTSKNLSIMILLENLTLFIMSLLSGLVFGVVFSKLFFVALNHQLPYNPVVFELPLIAFITTAIVFFLINLCNFLFIQFYIRRTSIIDILKASQTNEKQKGNILLGLIALCLFFWALFTLGRSSSEEADIWLRVRFAILLAAPYFIYGSLISLILKVAKPFKKFYHTNMLILGNLSQRFGTFKKTLYLVSVLMTSAIFFVGLFYSSYVSSVPKINKYFPYDVSYVETALYNKTETGDLLTTLKKKGSTVTSVSSFEFIDVFSFKTSGQNITMDDSKTNIIAARNYNKHMKENIEVPPGKAVYISSVPLSPPDPKENMVLTSLQALPGLERKLANSFDMEKKKQILSDALSKGATLTIQGNRLTSLNKPFTNFVYDYSAYHSGDAFILNDEQYNQFRKSVSQSAIKVMHLIKGNIPEEAFTALKEELKQDNGFTHNEWTYKKSVFDISDNEQMNLKEDLLPVYKQKQLGIEKEQTGSRFFLMAFIGAILTLAAGVVLFYKVLADIDRDKKRIVSLKRIGITTKEIRTLISKELAIIFFVPIFFSLLVGAYMSLTDYFHTTDFLPILMHLSIVWSFFIIIQIGMYIISFRKYMKELNQLDS